MNRIRNCLKTGIVILVKNTKRVSMVI